MIRAFVAICLFGGVLAQSRPKYCSNTQTVRDFNLTKFLGGWYHVANDRYPAFDCQFDEYLSNGTNVFIIRHGQNHHHHEQQFNPNERLTVRVNSPSQPGLLRIIYPQNNEPVYYMVLYTNYDYYAIIYECGNMYNEGTVYVLSRNRIVTRSLLSGAAQYIEDRNVGTGGRLHAIPQTNCKNSIIW